MRLVMCARVPSRLRCNVAVLKRSICGYHQDERADWVAELDCYHNQHVRHQPPFFNRPWVVTEAGRAEKLGLELNCVRCDRLEFPENLTPYKQTPTFTQDTIPSGLQKEHNTKAGVWGQIHVLTGSLRYEVLDQTPMHTNNLISHKN